MKKIICLYGGPGAGKTKTMHKLVGQLKESGHRAEANPEYIKDWVWEKRHFDAGDQTYFFCKQARKERIFIKNNVNFIVTDSPLILTHFYGLKYDWLEQQFNTSEILLKHHHAYCKKFNYKTEHYVIERSFGYDPAGRNQTEEEARIFDVEIKTLLENKNIKYKSVKSSTADVDIVKDIFT